MPSVVVAVVGGKEITDEGMERLAKYVRPMWGDVLVLPSADPETINVGGLELVRPEESKNPHPTEGLVISVGPQVDQAPAILPDGSIEKDEHEQQVMNPIFMAGDRVVFSRYSGFKMTFPDGVTLLLVPQGDIRGVLHPDCPTMVMGKKPSFVPK